MKGIYIVCEYCGEEIEMDVDVERPLLEQLKEVGVTNDIHIFCDEYCNKEYYLE